METKKTGLPFAAGVLAIINATTNVIFGIILIAASLTAQPIYPRPSVYLYEERFLLAGV